MREAPKLLASEASITVEWAPLWLTALVCVPTVIALIVLVIVLLRERRRQPHP
jgi:hypothetical protein